MIDNIAVGDPVLDNATNYSNQNVGIIRKKNR